MATFKVTLRDSASWCKGRGLVLRKGIPTNVPDGPVLDVIRASGLFSIVELNPRAPEAPAAPLSEVKEPEPVVAEPEETPNPSRPRKGKKRG